MAQEPFNTATWMRGQWSNPSDIFTILLIIGGDVVQVAIAQLCAGPIPFLTPVVFSFGWVTYAVSAMLSAVGDNRLMPQPEVGCCIINAKSGYKRENCSWVLSRILRDFEHWRGVEPGRIERDKLADLRKQELNRDPDKQRDPLDIRIGLRVTVWQYLNPPVKPSGDLVYWAGLLVAAVQLAIAAIPWGLYGEWLVFLIVATGTVLAFASGALPQWQKEKYGVRRPKDQKDVFLTRGNGDHDALLILGPERGLDLEALASPYRELGGLTWTRTLSLLLATMWILLLITIAGYEQRTWYLMGTGMIGILHNVAIAGVPRKPKAFGIDLEYAGTIVDEKVMSVLWAVEAEYPKAGVSLIAEFFPGDLFPREEKLKAYAERRSKAYKDAKKAYEKAVKEGRQADRPVLWKMPPLKRKDDSDIPESGEYQGTEGTTAQQTNGLMQNGGSTSRDHVIRMS